MVTYRLVTHRSETIEVSCDDLLIIGSHRQDLFCFMLQGSPKLIMPVEQLLVVEQSTDGEFVGQQFQRMLDSIEYG